MRCRIALILSAAIALSICVPALAEADSEDAWAIYSQAYEANSAGDYERTIELLNEAAELGDAGATAGPDDQ